MGAERLERGRGSSEASVDVFFFFLDARLRSYETYLVYFEGRLFAPGGGVHTLCNGYSVKLPSLLLTISKRINR